MDFALWKAAKPGEPSWGARGDRAGQAGTSNAGESCTIWAITSTFTAAAWIYISAPRKRNRSIRSVHRCRTFVRFWVHNGLVNMDSEKMSKSLGNVVSVEALLEKHPAPFLRFFLLNTHYRSPVELSDEALADARRGWRRLTGTVRELQAFMDRHGVARWAERVEAHRRLALSPVRLPRMLSSPASRVRCQDRAGRGGTPAIS